uniref:Uncharacterized protein n=1 Tax=Amphimedon queenslandica TaxID=400682 RepID=A0A1X7VLT5_AMPQE
ILFVSSSNNDNNTYCSHQIIKLPCSILLPTHQCYNILSSSIHHE